MFGIPNPFQGLGNVKFEGLSVLKEVPLFNLFPQSFDNHHRRVINI
jgi:hypothetical protein